MNNLLWFLLFLLIPIIVHLFNFRRAKKIAFTNVRFIQKASSESKSKTKIKHVLILATRILVFVLALMSFFLFLQDSLDTQGGGRNSSSIFYLDNSVSSFLPGILETKEILEHSINANDSRLVYMLTNDFNSFSNAARPKNEVLQYASEVKESYVGRSLKQVLDRTPSIFSQLTLISDFQTSDLEDFERIKLDSLREYRLIIQNYDQPTNVYVDSVFLNRDVENYSYNLLTCILGKSSESNNISNVVIKLLNSNGNQISSVIVDLNKESKVTFSVPRESDDIGYVLQLSGDDLTYDNEFYISTSTNRNPSILLLNQKENDFLSSVFGNEKLFNLTSLQSSQIDYGLIQNMDLIVLNGYYQLPGGLIEQNMEEVTFIVVPGDSIDLAAYSNELKLGLTLLRTQEFSELSISNKYLFDGVFENFISEVNMPKASPRYQVVSGGDKLIGLRTNFSFLTRSVSRPVYFFASPLVEDYTELPIHSIFLPLMYRIAESSLKTNSQLFFYPNDYLELPVPINETPLKLVASNIEVVPEFAAGNNSTVVKIPSNLPPGFYHLVQETDTVETIGLNLPKSESMVPEFGRTEIETFFEGVKHVKVLTDKSSVLETLNATTGSSSYWKYALVLSLVFVLLETLFHKYLK